MPVFFAFLHHLAAFALVGALAAEFILIGQVLSIDTAKRLVKADTVLGAAAVVLLIVGLARVFFFEKGETYYIHNYAFLTKLSVFIAVAVLSMTPTIEFLSWREALNAGQLPKVDGKKLRSIKNIIHIELAAIVIIVLCAAIMARGGVG
jgi:putative membrane protein